MNRTTQQELHPPTTDPVKTERHSTDSQLITAKLMTLQETANLLSKSSSKTCNLDPLPLNLPNEYSAVLTIPITNIISKCLLERMPNEKKAAVIIPVLQKSYIDNETLQRYRYISNMCFYPNLS